MLNFPDNPTVNQVFTAGSQTWVYDGAKWVAYGVAQGIYLPLTGGKLTGALNPAGGIIGVTDGSDAAPGFVGEVISNVNTAGVPLTTVTNANITTIPLTPGDWDVFGEAWFNFSAAGVTIAGALNVNSALLPTGGAAMNTSRVQLIAPTSAGLQSLTLACRASLATTTTYYLIGQAGFASGTVTATGKIWARRTR